jgi:integrase
MQLSLQSARNLMAIHLLNEGNLPTKAGLHGDGNGLYLEVRANGSMYWLFRYLWQGKQKKMFHAGSAVNVRAADARAWAADQQRKLAQTPPVDPKEDRDMTRYAQGAPLFLDYALSCIDDWSKGWVNPKHHDQWLMTVKVYAKPLHKKRLNDISATDVINMLRPIWYSKEETARRLRGRVERILKAAKYDKHRTGDNPAELDGIKAVLGKQRGKKLTEHHPALPYEELPAFMTKLRGEDYVTARMLELTILTCVRTGEMLGMEWREIDFDKRLWTIPKGTRMKNKEVEHIVPLGDCAVEILREMQKLTGHGKYVFPGRRTRKKPTEQPMSNMAMDRVLKDLVGSTPATVHGMRSTFEDWAGDETSHDDETRDFALHHVEGDETKAAYRRRTALKKRVELMKDWENYCYGEFKKAPPAAKPNLQLVA